MTHFVSISDVKKNPSLLAENSAKGDVSIVLKNNKPAFVAVPYVEGIEEAIEDILPLKASFIAELEKAKKQVREGKVYSSTDVRTMLDLD